jgi:signal transduction histidine kinase/CheY-like chemotaxis protein
MAYHADLEAAVADRTRELSQTNARLQQEMATNERERLKAEEQEEVLRRSQKLESLGILAGGIAHDFNNLLGAILGNLNLLQLQTPAGTPGEGYLANMELAVNRARNLTLQMLAYSGKGHFTIKSLDLNQVVRELTSLLEVCISKRTELKLELTQEPCHILGDPAQLQQVVMNLVTNASEALAGQDGGILISTRVQDLDAAAAAKVSELVATLPGPHVVLEVRDTGPGMKPAVLARIFDPFFTTKESGRGLGLSAMLGILRAHGCGIEILSRPMAGTTFRLFFPASAGVPERAPALAHGGHGPFKGQALVVDDEPEVLETARLLLENLGLRVASARNGLEALAFMGSHGADIDLVLLDLTMPHMDGRQTLRALRRLRPGLPVILCSGYDPRQALPEHQNLEAPTFLQKPYTLNDLQRVLALALNSAAASSR